MNRICGWWASVLSRALEKNEREVVTGDLFESGESGSRALRGVVGLVARRQAEIWSDWRPWLTLACVLFPLGVLLSIVSGGIEGISSVYGWLYFHNWDWRLLQNRAFWYILGQSLQSLFGGYLRIACLSWSAGFLLGRKIRCLRTGILGFLFCLMLALGVLKGAPAYWAFQFHEMEQWRQVARVPALRLPVAAQRNPVADWVPYRTILPLAIVAMFVALPTLLGVRYGKAGTMRPRMARFAVPVASLALAGTILEVPGIISLVLLKVGIPPGTWHGDPPFMHLVIGLLMALTYWPLAYLLVRIVQGLGERLVEFWAWRGVGSQPQ